MKIDFEAANANLMAVADGAVATISVNGSDELVGVVTNHTSSDGYTVSTFGVDAKGHKMSAVVMTNDSSVVKFEVIAASVEEFYAAKNQGYLFGFFRDVCEHYKWVFDDYAALNGAYWLSKSFEKIDSANMAAAAEVVAASREQFYTYIKAARLGPAA